uniref:pectinesterase n=1 Tax=Quercus lobata TaxID=97700 RepID=A0A7N2LD05_QUELO
MKPTLSKLRLPSLKIFQVTETSPPFKAPLILFLQATPCGYEFKFLLAKTEKKSQSQRIKHVFSLMEQAAMLRLLNGNTYNIGLYSPKQKRHRPALAAEILGDKAAFYNCSFSGMQDTLWDATGRHYFYQCYIQGGVDFIFGNGQSFYEQSVIHYSLGTYGHGSHDTGYITAQGRDSADDPSGFVFKECVILGEGKAYLGRAWRAFSRVIIANSKLSDIVVPQGWNAWFNVGYEDQFTYVEVDNIGPGANTSIVFLG